MILTVGFFVVIDRQNVSTPIVTAIRDVWTTISGAVLVTDEQNTLSQCLTEDPTNLVFEFVMFLFRCLHGHVCQRSCGVVCHEVRNMVKRSQVTIDHVLVCNIHTMLNTVLTQ